MAFELHDNPDGTVQLAWHGAVWEARPLDPHDFNDLEAVLAQRKAMIGRCPARLIYGGHEHACGARPDHGRNNHVCRACTQTWTGP